MMLKKGIILSLILGLIIPMAALADSISPETFSTTLNVGESVTITKTVTVDPVPPESGMVDVLFLADTTGSMGSAISNVRSGASSIMSSVSGLGDVQFAVAEYKDIYDSYSWRINTGLTSDNASVQSGINTWSAYGGDDSPEGQLIALTELASTVDWREGSTRMIVWFGDYYAHDPRNGYTEEGAIAALNASNISVEALSVGYDHLDDTGQATRIAAATGGHVYNDIATSEVASAITDAIETSLETYSSVSLDISDAPDGVNVTVSDAYTGDWERDTEREFSFDVTFSGVTEGVYDFGINALVDGGIVATEWDSIIVDATTPGGGPAPVPEPATMFLLSSGLLGIAGYKRKKK